MDFDFVFRPFAGASGGAKLGVVAYELCPTHGIPMLEMGEFASVARVHAAHIDFHRQRVADEAQGC